MIRKSGYRFSENITHRQNAEAQFVRPQAIAL